MKTAFLIFFLLVLIAIKADAGLPPTTIKGQQDASQVTNFNTQVPNKQATKVSGAYLIETGNKNILANPDFEHSTASTGWTCSPSAIEENTIVISGKKSIVVAPSAATMECYQDSTLYSTQFADGVQGLAMVRVKTSVSGIKVCPRSAGATSSLCVDVNSDGKWGKPYKIPFILGATSNGISIHSNGVTVSGNIYIDDAFVGAVDLKQDIPIDADSYIRLDTANGYGSTNTMIRRFTNIINNVGTDITYADSATLGATLTINTSGLYSISFSDQFSGAQPLGISKSSAALTTSISSIAVAERLAIQSTSAANVAASASWEGYLVAGDVIRPHNSGQASGTTPALSSFTIAKRGGGTSSVYTTPSDSFSTDENVFAHKTTAIVAADPIGTYTTYSYTISSNTQTICATPPTTVPTSANGVLIYTRAYNAASTCNLPAKYEIKIGTGMLARSVDVFKSAAKTTLGATDYVWAGNAASGLGVQGYDAVSGLLVIDAGYNWASTTTTALFSFNNNTTQTSGYLVINAQKKKDFIIGDFNEVITSPGISRPIETSAVVDCDAGSLSSASQDGTPWISSSTNISGGACTLTLVSGTFSSTPKCLINWSDTGGAGGTGKIVYNTATSATSITVDCEDDASTNCTSYDYTIFCKGSRP